MSTSKSSPFKIDPITIGAVSWGISALGTIISGTSASR